MKPVLTHTWNLTEQDAWECQHQLAAKVISSDQFSNIQLVAGVDVAYSTKNDSLFSAAVIIDVESMKIIETASAKSTVSFPYIPGLFSFRELPAILNALEKLMNTPDLIVCDGQGVAHPRRFGLACHLGVLCDIPCIGCGKTRLVGESAKPEITRGSFSDLIDQDEIIGRVLRTQDNVKPVYVSVGHRISLATASDWILQLAPHYRLPETTRAADQAVNMLMKKSS